MLKDDLIAYIPQIEAREITNRDLAARLGVNEYYLCRVLKAMGIKRKPGERNKRKRLAEARKEHRRQVAKALPIKEAVKAANCSIRTIYRYLHEPS